MILFDGQCRFCHGAVGFVVRRDPRARFRFAALGSQAADRLLAEHGHRGPLPDSVVLLVEGRVLVRSSAALQIARRLRWPWPLCAVGLVVPRWLRDWLYDVIAARRYRWFGRAATCLVPTPELRARFLDRDEQPAAGG